MRTDQKVHFFYVATQQFMYFNSIYIVLLFHLYGNGATAGLYEYHEYPRDHWFDRIAE